MRTLLALTILAALLLAEPAKSADLLPKLIEKTTWYDRWSSMTGGPTSCANKEEMTWATSMLNFKPYAWVLFLNNAPVSVHLNPELCAMLRGRYGDSYDLVVAVWVLAHERYHVVMASHDEERADCFASQNIYKVAKLGGYILDRAAVKDYVGQGC